MRGKDLKTIDHFAEMIAEDLRWFFTALSLCSHVTHLLMAGMVSRFYIDDFISCHAPRYGYVLARRDYLGVKPRTMLYDLHSSDREIRVFYCGVGPSFRGGAALIRAFERHIEVLTSEGFAANSANL
jgi:hypothetical protein